MNSEVFYVLFAVLFIVAVGVFVFVMVELRATSKALRDFIRTTDSSLKPTVEELQQVIKTMKHATDNVADVSEDVRVFSGSVKSIGENLKHVSDLVESATSSTVIEVSSLRAGIRAAKEVLIRKLGSSKT